MCHKKLQPDKSTNAVMLVLYCHSIHKPGSYAITKKKSTWQLACGANYYRLIQFHWSHSAAM